jgi:hypothetical protein
MPILPLDRADYLAAFHLASISILVAKPGIQIVAARSLPREGRLAAVWWVDAIEIAHTVRELVLMSDLRSVRRVGPLFTVPVPSGCAAAEAAAARLNARLVPHAAVLDKARGALRRLDGPAPLARTGAALCRRAGAL